MTEQLQQWMQSLEQQLEQAKTCSDSRKAEEKAQQVLRESAQLSAWLVSILPEQVRHYWVSELGKLEEEGKELHGVGCSYCAKIVKEREGLLCPLGCRDKFCNKTCLKRGLQEHRKSCLMEKKRKLRRALEQNGMEWLLNEHFETEPIVQDSP